MSIYIQYYFLVKRRAFESLFHETWRQCIAGAKDHPQHGASGTARPRDSWSFSQFRPGQCGLRNWALRRQNLQEPWIPWKKGTRQSSTMKLAKYSYILTCYGVEIVGGLPLDASGIQLRSCLRMFTWASVIFYTYTHDPQHHGLVAT